MMFVDPRDPEAQHSWRETINSRNVVLVSAELAPLWQVYPIEMKSKAEELKNYITLYWNERGVESLTDFMPLKFVGIEFTTSLEKTGDDGGSGATQNLSYYESKKPGWLMLGHSNGSGMHIVREKENLFKKPDSFEMVWNDKGGRGIHSFAVYIPTSSDPDYVALGAVCVFGTSGFPPPTTYIYAMAHKSICEPCGPGQAVWNDDGSWAHDDVTLSLHPLGHLWVTHATRTSIPQMYTILKKFLPKEK